MKIVNEETRINAHNEMRKYLEFERNLREHRDSFFTSYIDGRVVKEATQALTHEKLVKLIEMEKELEKLHNQYRETLKQMLQ